MLTLKSFSIDFESSRVVTKEILWVKWDLKK